MSRALASVGLPPPVAIRPLGRPLLGRAYELAFPEGARLRAAVLRVAPLDPGWGGVSAERAALRVAHLFTDLPVAREYAVLDPGLDGPALSLASKLPGVSGATLLAGGGPLAEEAARAVGRVLSTLESAFQPGFATRATPEGELLPRRGSWRAEVAALVEGWIARAAAGGTGLGPISDRLIARVRDDLGALDTVYGWSLVHGDLHPGNLLHDPASGALTGVVDWGLAIAGDPLWDLALSLSVPAPTLARVIEGYGRERAAEWLDPDALARLGVYARARCLMRLALAALPGLGDGEGRARALLLEHTRARAQELVEEDAPRRRLEAALAAAPAPLAAWARPTGEALLTRRALEVARHGERLGASAIGVASALACAENAARIAEDRPRQATLLLGERLLPRVAAATAPLPGEPIPDRPAFWRALVAKASAELELLREPGPTGGLALLALARRAEARLDGGLSDATLRGVEALFFGLLQRERVARSQELPPARRLLEAWAGAWAARELGLEGLLDPRLARQARAGWEALAAPGGAEGPELDGLLARWSEDPARGADPLLPIALLAWGAGTRPPGLAVHPGRVLAALRLIPE